MMKGFFIKVRTENHDKLKKLVKEFNNNARNIVLTPANKLYLFKKEKDVFIIFFDTTTFSGIWFGSLAKKVIHWGFKKRLKKENIKFHSKLLSDGEGNLFVIKNGSKSRCV